MRARHFAVALLGLSVCVTCVRPKLYAEWDGVTIRAIQPSKLHKRIRAAIEMCTGRKLAGWPHMYIAPVETLWVNGDPSYAVYTAPSASIIFAKGTDRMGWVVAHELLHWHIADLVPPAPAEETWWQRRARTHPTEYFAKRCKAHVEPNQES